jgi:hypothetical protein
MTRSLSGGVLAGTDEPLMVGLAFPTGYVEQSNLWACPSENRMAVSSPFHGPFLRESSTQFESPTGQPRTGATKPPVFRGRPAGATAAVNMYGYIYDDKAL